MRSFRAAAGGLDAMRSPAPLTSCATALGRGCTRAVPPAHAAPTPAGAGSGRALAPCLASASGVASAGASPAPGPSPLPRPSLSLALGSYRAARAASDGARAAPLRTAASTSAASAAAPGAPSGPSAKDLAAAQLLGDDALRALGVRLPSHCCGCGMRLQRRDPEAPGYFIIPSRLLEPRGAEGEGEGADPLAAAAGEELDAEAEADMEDVGRSRADEPDVLCQRCFSLKHAGKVKTVAAEMALPDFDLGKKVGRKIHLQKDRRAVVLCVVDMWDFDGSLPRAALRSLFPPGTGDEAPEELKFRLMVAVNKFDLLPAQATPLRVQQWVRTRLKQAGLPSPDKVFIVSAARGSGVKEMVEDVREALGFRGDLWVVGAQNAGKSSLISAMKRLAGTAGKGDPTVAPVPGTTLGLLQVPGMPLGPKHRAFDTPGVPHPHQLTTQLGLEDVKKVLPSKPLRGRTYRLAAGNTLLLGGGLARLDVLEAPGATLYLTVFVSHHVNLHLGKTEGAEERLPRLVAGGVLVPPDCPERAAALPALAPVEVALEGSDWRRSSVDVAIAGLGWVGVGCSGPARFRVWTLPGVAVTTHAALIPDYAEVFERPGVSSLLPKAQKGAQKGREAARGAREPARGGREAGGGERTGGSGGGGGRGGGSGAQRQR
ncbi:hypothetical protein HYH03_018745 [Edaphochlamys debaryana]|uniref:G domain-containing protein n=1 Tax=Edaphochlamys debaryana TaxID=47281 RepID=A0A836BP75_9CHLO|nr:hypothetical protein HYH03_018745 [Edaphochlamys debaryana]|eukprot:KAG2482323.1 hypothetical protein HYH03_018745 [Edaphochlamys debaryana]